MVKFRTEKKWMKFLMLPFVCMALDLSYNELERLWMK